MYNVEVEEFHTYFVGCDEWGFSVWAHNLCFDDGIDHLVKMGVLKKQEGAALKADAAFRKLWEEGGGWQTLAEGLGHNLAERFTPEVMSRLVKERSPLLFRAIEGGQLEVTPAFYKMLRQRTPNDSLRDLVNSGYKRGMADEALPGLRVLERLEADHIVPMKRITEMPGFKEINYENMLRVLNFKPNYTGLSKAANTSKGEQTFAQWLRHDKLGINVDPAFRAKMMAEEARLEPILKTFIQKLLKTQ